jgi:hypothetical protein
LISQGFSGRCPTWWTTGRIRSLQLLSLLQRRNSSSRTTAIFFRLFCQRLARTDGEQAYGVRIQLCAAEKTVRNKHIGIFGAVFDDLGEQLDFAQLICSGKHELVRKNLLRLSTSEFDGEKMVILSQHTTNQLYRDYPALLGAETENSGLVSAKTILRRNFSSAVMPVREFHHSLRL